MLFNTRSRWFHMRSRCYTLVPDYLCLIIILYSSMHHGSQQAKFKDSQGQSWSSCQEAFLSSMQARRIWPFSSQGSCHPQYNWGDFHDIGLNELFVTKEVLLLSTSLWFACWMKLLMKRRIMVTTAWVSNWKTPKMLIYLLLCCQEVEESTQPMCLSTPRRG